MPKKKKTKDTKKNAEKNNANNTKEYIDEETLLKVAKIARLNLTDKEIENFKKDLNEILEAFKILDKAKTEEEPAFHPINMTDVMRSDKEEPCFSQEKALANTKHKENGFFQGPRAV